MALELQIDTRVQHDTTKPIGEACNTDGTLKDASEIDWLNSPSDEMPQAPALLKRTRSVDLNTESDVNSKRPRVSENLFVYK